MKNNKVSSKRAKHKTKKSYDANKNVITWNVLKELSQSLVTTLSQYEQLVSTMAATYPDRLNDLRTKESYIGFYKLVKEHLEQVNKLAALHTLLDKDGNPRKDDKGVYLYIKGICRTPDEMTKVSTLAMEYMSEFTQITQLGSKVIPELAVQFQVSEDMLKVVKDIQNDVTELEGKALNEMTASMGELANTPEEEVKEENERE